MSIRWKEEMLQFETLYEAEVWADSITNEIHGRPITGYCTSDFKVATILAFYLAENLDYRVRSATVHLDQEIYYQVWVELKE